MKIKEENISIKNFKLFECCILVKGIKRGIIYDLRRIKFDYVPLDLINIIEKFDGKKIQDVIDEYGIENKEIIFEYFNYLIEEEYIFFTSLPTSLFPKLPLEFERPFQISNAIIDVTATNLEQVKLINQQLEEIGCEAVLLRFIKEIDKKLLQETLTIFKNSSYKAIEILCKERAFLRKEFVNDFCLINTKVMKIIVMNSNINSVDIIKPATVMFIRTKEAILDSSRNVVHVNNFNVSMELYMESKLYNNYYYRKVYFDSNGNIKNSPETTRVFGNIANAKLVTIVTNNEFKELGLIKKDDLKSCKVCEYRYMCVDSRIPKKKKLEDREWFFTEECNYNPYLAKWSS